MPGPTEAYTRKELIDPALKKAGWDPPNPDQVGLEIPVDGFDPKAWKKLKAKLKRLRERGEAYEAALPKGVKMLDPQPNERIGDLAAGTCGFLVNAYEHIFERHTSPDILSYDSQGEPHNLVGDRLQPEQWAFLQNGALKGYDNDSGMTMLRIGSMNLMLHGIDAPQFYYADTLSKNFGESRAYDVILMNPPFTGAVDRGDVSDSLPGDTRKSELLFVHLILRALDMGGRCAVIVPDGVLFVGVLAQPPQSRVSGRAAGPDRTAQGGPGPAQGRPAGPPGRDQPADL